MSFPETRAFAQQVATLSPALDDILREHEAAYEEILPHVYFGEISEWVTDAVASGRHLDTVHAVIDLLESSYTAADPEVQNVIDASFVENVEHDPAVVRLFGPVLTGRVQPEFRLPG